MANSQYRRWRKGRPKSQQSRLVWKREMAERRTQSVIDRLDHELSVEEAAFLKAKADRARAIAHRDLIKRKTEAAEAYARRWDVRLFGKGKWQRRVNIIGLVVILLFLLVSGWFFFGS